MPVLSGEGNPSWITVLAPLTQYDGPSHPLGIRLLNAAVRAGECCGRSYSATRKASRSDRAAGASDGEIEKAPQRGHYGNQHRPLTRPAVRTTGGRCLIHGPHEPSRVRATRPEMDGRAPVPGVQSVA